jgi:hypothetical protein
MAAAPRPAEDEHFSQTQFHEGRVILNDKKMVEAVGIEPDVLGRICGNCGVFE